MTDGDPETVVSASLQEIKSIKNPIKHFFNFIFYFVKSETSDSFVNHFDGHFAYLKTLDFYFKAKRKLQGTNVFIGEDFSSRVSDVRRRLVPHLKKARSENKKCMMVFDHLIVDGKKFTLDDGDNLQEMR